VGALAVRSLESRLQAVVGIVAIIISTGSWKLSIIRDAVWRTVSILLFQERNLAMRHLLFPSAVLLMVAVGATVAAEEIKSGLQVGERTTPFNIRDITGPNAGKTLCYR
jgi:hypothetical protein